MTTIQQLHRFLLIFAVSTSTLTVATASPDERDRQVFEALLLHLLADSKFNMTRVPTKGSTIVLHTRTPEKTGLLRSEQIQRDIDRRKLPAEAGTDLRRRNTPAKSKPNNYDSVMASYKGLKFPSSIKTADLSAVWKWDSYGLFEDKYPKSRGWLEAYLPGYSAGGTQAVVRAGVGPWVHGAMLTAVLAKRGEKWSVVWYHVAYYV